MKELLEKLLLVFITMFLYVQEIKFILCFVFDVPIYYFKIYIFDGRLKKVQILSSMPLCNAIVVTVCSEKLHEAFICHVLRFSLKFPREVSDKESLR